MNRSKHNRMKSLGNKDDNNTLVFTANPGKKHEVVTRGN